MPRDVSNRGHRIWERQVHVSGRTVEQRDEHAVSPFCMTASVGGKNAKVRPCPETLTIDELAVIGSAHADACAVRNQRLTGVPRRTGRRGKHCEHPESGKPRGPHRLLRNMNRDTVTNFRPFSVQGDANGRRPRCCHPRLDARSNVALIAVKAVGDKSGGVLVKFKLAAVLPDELDRVCLAEHINGVRLVGNADAPQSRACRGVEFTPMKGLADLLRVRRCGEDLDPSYARKGWRVGRCTDMMNVINGNAHDVGAGRQRGIPKGFMGGMGCVTLRMDVRVAACDLQKLR